MAPIMALIPNIFKATSMSLLFVSTAAKLRSLDSKRSWASLPTKTPFRCGVYLNLHQMDKHMIQFESDNSKNILRVTFSKNVEPDQTRLFVETAKTRIADLKPGF